jgi:hypothetical protein
VCLACSMLDGMSSVERRVLPSRSEWVLAEMELRRRAAGLPRHACVVAWQSGALSRHDLMVFAGEYDRVVGALAAAARRVAVQAGGGPQGGLEAVAADLEADVERWRAFAVATGWHDAGAWQRRRAPSATTARSAASVAGAPDGGAGATLATLWAGMTTQLALAPPQAVRLFASYGVDPAGAVWFDHRPEARRWLPVIEADLAGAALDGDPYVLLRAVRLGFAATTELFDALETERATRVREEAA